MNKSDFDGYLNKLSHFANEEDEDSILNVLKELVVGFNDKRNNQ